MKYTPPNSNNKEARVNIDNNVKYLSALDRLETATEDEQIDSATAELHKLFLNEVSLFFYTWGRQIEFCELVQLGLITSDPIPWQLNANAYNHLNNTEQLNYGTPNIEAEPDWLIEVKPLMDVIQVESRKIKHYLEVADIERMYSELALCDETLESNRFVYKAFNTRTALQELQKVTEFIQKILEKIVVVLKGYGVDILQEKDVRNPKSDFDLEVIKCNTLDPCRFNILQVLSQSKKPLKKLEIISRLNEMKLTKKTNNTMSVEDFPFLRKAGFVAMYDFRKARNDSGRFYMLTSLGKSALSYYRKTRS